MSSESLHNVLLIWNRMGDYHRARWNQFSRSWNRGTVYAADLGGADQLYQWEPTEQNHYFRLSAKPVEEPDFIQRFRNFKRIVKKHQIATVCIPGYGRKEYVVFLLWCKVKGIDVIVFAESWYGRNTLVNKLKSIFLNYVCRKFFVSGLRAEKHFHENLNVPLANIRKGYSVVDNRHFYSLPVERKEKILLCVARFSAEKNHQLLFSAFLKSDLSETWKLQCVGGGPLLTEFRAKFKNQYSIALIEWADYHDLPTLYANASAFILPSCFEPWGLVVNEAMAAGLPIIVSDACGCMPDLARSNNGWIFKSNDETELIDIFNQLRKTQDNALKNHGENSAQRIQDFSLDHWSDQLTQLINHAAN